MNNNKNSVKEACVIIGANSILSVALKTILCDAGYEVYSVFNENRNRIIHDDLLFSIQQLDKVPQDVKTVFFISSCIPRTNAAVHIPAIVDTNILLLHKISARFASAKLIHSSSVSLFKESKEEITEVSEILPGSYYAISKLFAERIVVAHPGGGVNVRISSLFGTSMNGGTFLPAVMREGITTKKITLFGDGSRMQNYISASEAAYYMYKATGYNGDTNLLAVSNESLSNKIVANIVKEVIGDVEIIFKGEDHSPGYFYNNKFTREVLGITGADTKAAIIKTIQWERKQFL